MRRLGAFLTAILATSPGVADAVRAQQVEATSSVVVRVVEPDYAPLRGATVYVDGRGILTDSTGAARFAAVPAGKHQLRVVATGYALVSRELRVEADGPTTVEVRLEVRPVLLGALEVTGSGREAYLVANGFYDRERMGGATFISGERLRKVQRNSNQLVDALRGVSGVAVLPNGSGTGWWLVSTRGEISVRNRCFPQVFVDGLRQPYPSPIFADFNTIMPLAEVGAIEVYAGSHGVPLEFGRHPCGTVLIWSGRGTRRR